MARHNDTGQWGEQMAADYLVSRGYAIVARNARIGRVEVDIIAMGEGSIVFAEVKTRSDVNSDPANAVNFDKLKRLCKAADLYVREHDITFDPRIDMICVTGSPENGVSAIRHYPDCFIPTTGTVNIPVLPDCP